MIIHDLVPEYFKCHIIRLLIGYPKLDRVGQGKRALISTKSRQGDPSLCVERTSYPLIVDKAENRSVCLCLKLAFSPFDAQCTATVLLYCTRYTKRCGAMPCLEPQHPCNTDFHALLSNAPQYSSAECSTRELQCK